MSEEAERRAMPELFPATTTTPAWGGTARQKMPSLVRENWDEKSPSYYAISLVAHQQVERMAEAIDAAALGADLLAILVRERADEVTHGRLPWMVRDALGQAQKFADGPDWFIASSAVAELLYVVRKYLGTTAADPFRFADEKRPMATVKLKEPGDDHA